MFGGRGLHNNDNIRPPARALREPEMTKASQQAPRCEHGLGGRSPVTCFGASWWLLQAFSDLEASLYTPCHCHEDHDVNALYTLSHFTAYYHYCLYSTTATCKQKHTNTTNSSRQPASPVFLSYHTPARLQLAGACTTTSFLPESVPIRASARHTSSTKDTPYCNTQHLRPPACSLYVTS